MRIHLRHAAICDDSSTGKRFLQCVFSVDEKLRNVALEIIPKGSTHLLALDNWSWINLISSQQLAFQQMREWLFLPINGLPLPENAFVDV